MSAAKYQFMPPLSESEYAALEADIQINGIEVAVVVDESDDTIDGHHRREIADRLGIDYAKDVREGLTEEEKRRLAFTLNATRRNLGTAAKRALVAESLRLDPQLSDRGHARTCGVDHKTVASVRAELEQAGEVGNFPTRIGADGVEQPATKPPVADPHRDEPETDEAPTSPPVDLGADDGVTDGGVETSTQATVPGPCKPAGPTKKPPGRDRPTLADLEYELSDAREQIKQLKAELAERDHRIAELRAVLAVVKARLPAAKPKESQHDRLLRGAREKLAENGPMSDLPGKFQGKDRHALDAVLEKARADGLVVSTPNPNRRGSVIWALTPDKEETGPRQGDRLQKITTHRRAGKAIW